MQALSQLVSSTLQALKLSTPPPEIDPDAERLRKVDLMLEDLELVVSESLSQSDGNSNIFLLDVSDAYVKPAPEANEEQAKVESGAFRRPKGIEEIHSAAYQKFWNGLTDTGLKPYLAAYSVGRWNSGEVRCVIAVSEEKAKEFLQKIEAAKLEQLNAVTLSTSAETVTVQEPLESPAGQPVQV